MFRYFRQDVSVQILQKLTATSNVALLLVFLLLLLLLLLLLFFGERCEQPLQQQARTR